MIIAKPLSHDSFLEYGTFASLTPPKTRPLVTGGVFWPDCATIYNSTPASQLSIGVCQARWRPWSISTCEFHTKASEGILPLDGDVYIHVALPTRDEKVVVDSLEVFFVPQGTMVVLKPGVWHHAPFPAQEGAAVNVQILLPPRTYADDCIVYTLVEPVQFTL